MLLARGGEAGLGHLARCTALAQALQLRGVTVEARAIGMSVEVTVDGLVWRPDRDEGEGGARAFDIAIVDGYDIGRERLAGLDPASRYWMHAPPPVAVGDPWLGLDPGPDGPTADVGPPLAASLEDACLRRSYWPGPPVREHRSTVGSVLVTVGGSDAGGPVGALAAVVRDALPEAAVTMVRGPQSASEAPRGVKVVDAPTGLRDLLVAVDMAVTAAGQTMLEALALGTPTVALVRADNQRAQADLAVLAEAALVSDEAALAGLLPRLSKDRDLRHELAERGPAAVDGLGSHRVADRLLRSIGGPSDFPCFGLDLRRASQADGDFLFELRNDPSAFPLYGTPRAVSHREHRGWLERTLAREGSELFVVEQDHSPCGQLRLDRCDCPRGPDPRPPWELSISLRPDARGAGVGRRAIAAGALLAWVRYRSGPLRASVHPENTASLRAFRASGFVPAGRDDSGFEQLVLERRLFDWSGPSR